MSHDNESFSVAASLDPPQADEPPIDAEQVEEYLLRNADFFVHRPELLQAMRPPARWSGDTVVDLQRYMVESLRGEIAGLRDCANSVIETSRANLATQSRTHAAVLALVAAPEIELLVRAVTDDLPILLDVDVAAISVERSPSLQLMIGGIGHLRPGEVDRLLGPGRDLVLLREMTDDGTVFGAGAGLVRSAALARLQCGPAAPVGLLAFGSRNDDAFHPKQGTELLRFLAKIVEMCLIRLLPISG